MDYHPFSTQFVLESMAIVESGKKAQFTFHLNGKRIVVSIFSDSKKSSDDDDHKSVEDRLIHLITTAKDQDPDLYQPQDIQLYQRSVDEATGIIMDIGRFPFSNIAPPLKRRYKAPTDLHHQMFPETFDFRLEMINDTAFMVPITPAEAAEPRNDGGPDPNLKTDYQPDPNLRRYLTQDITFVKKYSGGIAQEVDISLETLVCKASTRGLEFEYLAPELIMLKKINAAHGMKLEFPLRIPSLRGYVAHPMTGAILGFVRSWVPPSEYGNTIQEAGRQMPSIHISIRIKWFVQVAQTIRALHSVGLVWGDVKAANVCIDANNDTWLIGFDGRVTSAWVDKDIAGTVEGDKHGLLKLRAFLYIKCPEISRAERDRLYLGITSSSE
ncbi:hypothetical protein FSHL1_012601 [Fusarium sambucinum]